MDRYEEQARSMLDNIGCGYEPSQLRFCAARIRSAASEAQVRVLALLGPTVPLVIIPDLVELRARIEKDGPL